MGCYWRDENKEEPLRLADTGYCSPSDGRGKRGPAGVHTFGVEGVGERTLCELVPTTGHLDPEDEQVGREQEAKHRQEDFVDAWPASHPESQDQDG